ncbi:hypothetical protein [Variovorax sp. YR566]|uniref:hypothetical protein n=1 Tax=Variovorax sp. YR566 TaxID=3450237 RepID=UPI003F816E81
MRSTDSSDPRPRTATGFQPGAPSANPTGRPTKLTRALRGLQPLVRLGVREDELQALAEAHAAGNPQCWNAALALIAGRLQTDLAVLAQVAQPVGAALAQTKEGSDA